MGKFNVASEDEILSGRTTDVYFKRAEEILRGQGKESTRVVAEVTSGSLPQGWKWGVFCGLEEAIHLLEGRDLDLYSLPEGTLFQSRSHSGIRLPVMLIEGPYGQFVLYETPLLGLICQATAIATKASRVKARAGDREVVSFGIRRMHPSVSPMIDRAAYIGGFDAVSSLKGAETIGKEARGTMPHALTIVLGGPEEAFQAFDKHISKDVPRIALVDTYLDEVAESLMAANLVPNLYGVRLDTPSSRKGDFVEIVRQVRWELDVRGFQHLKIFVSGGIDEDAIPALVEAGVAGFGVGTSVSNAPTVDFSLDLVEVEGRPSAKRGKYSGRKEVFRCKKDLSYEVGRKAPSCPVCGGTMAPVLKQYLRGGKLIRDLPPPDAIRQSVLKQMSKVKLEA